ncbi:DUF6817 domain-containing protein [Cupriavidus basilensis]
MGARCRASGRHLCASCRLGQSRFIALAGAFHSVYGTEEFAARALPLTSRGKIAALLGTEAERLVYFFCVADRRKVLRCAGRGARFISSPAHEAVFTARRAANTVPRCEASRPRCTRPYGAPRRQAKRAEKRDPCLSIALRRCEFGSRPLFACRRGGSPHPARLCLLFGKTKSRSPPAGGGNCL